METTAQPADPAPLPTQLALQPDDIKDVLHKELDLIQAVVARMASNSFHCKSWLIGLLTFVIALGRTQVLSLGWYGFVLLLPVLVFWMLDGFFLYVEQRYRELYAFTVAKRTGKRTEENPTYYDLNFTSFEHRSLVGAGLFRHFAVYLASRFRRIEHDPRIRLREQPERVKTVAGVMFSKTLLPFYLLPVIFIVLVVLNGAEVLKL